MNSDIGKLADSTINIHTDLIERCRESDPIAQYELYKLYAKAMHNTAFRIVGTQEDAEDVLQESFVSAFKNIKSYREEATFGAWLKRIVINKAITQQRKIQRDLMFAEDYEETEEIDVDQHASFPYDVNQVKEAIHGLPAGFRSVLTLYLFEGYDHQEISEILGISESTSKTQYKRAKDKLRSILIQEVKYG